MSVDSVFSVNDVNLTLKLSHSRANPLSAWGVASPTSSGAMRFGFFNAGNAVVLSGLSIVPIENETVIGSLELFANFDKQCSCLNGVAATDCQTHTDAKCTSCDYGFYLNDNDACDESPTMFIETKNNVSSGVASRTYAFDLAFKPSEPTSNFTLSTDVVVIGGTIESHPVQDTHDPLPWEGSWRGIDTYYDSGIHTLSANPMSWTGIPNSYQGGATFSLSYVMFD